jgi:hypothetical protein
MYKLIEMGMLPLDGENLCQFKTYVFKIRHMNRNMLNMRQILQVKIRVGNMMG